MKTLWLNDCYSLEEIYQFQGFNIEEPNVIPFKLKEMNLRSLPKLKYIWSKDPQEPQRDVQHGISTQNLSLQQMTNQIVIRASKHI